MELERFRAVAAVTISWASCVREALCDPKLMTMWALATKKERMQVAAVLGVPSQRKMSSLSNCGAYDEVEEWLLRHAPRVLYRPAQHRTLRDLTDEIVRDMVGTHVADADLKCLQTLFFANGGNAF